VHLLHSKVFITEGVVITGINVTLLVKVLRLHLYVQSLSLSLSPSLVLYLSLFWSTFFTFILDVCYCFQVLSRLGGGRPGFGFSLPAIASRPALGLTQPPLQRIPGVLSPGVKAAATLS